MHSLLVITGFARLESPVEPRPVKALARAKAAFQNRIARRARGLGTLGAKGEQNHGLKLE